MQVIDIYGKPDCIHCSYAKSLCKDNGYRFFYMDVSAPKHRDVLKARMPDGRKVKTVPQIFIGTEYVGGFAELLAMQNAGTLKARVG